jgi:hypothetical protein
MNACVTRKSNEPKLTVIYVLCNYAVSESGTGARFTVSSTMELKIVLAIQVYDVKLSEWQKYCRHRQGSRPIYKYTA